jgi:hypothetical protein
LLDLLVVGDSLPLPRKGDSFAAADPKETWPQVLSDLLNGESCWVRAQKGHMSLDVLTELHKLNGYLGPQSVGLTVIQCGIVDSAPRAYPHWIQDALDGRWGPVGSRALPRRWKPNRSPRLLRSWGRPWIEIQPPGPRLAELLGPFTVERYNDALQRSAARSQRVTFVPFSAKLHPDGHHLSRSDHSELARSVADYSSALA